jgi:capsular exopolysaccharide synthesis family protein
MDRPSETQTLADYLRALRARWRTVVLPGLVAGVAALVVSLSQSSVYRATSTISVNSQFIPPAQLGPQVGQTTAPPVTAALQLAKSDQVIVRVWLVLNGHPSVDGIRSSVTAAAQPTGPNLIDIAAEAGSGHEAARIANAFAQQMKSVALKETRRYFLNTARGAKNPGPMLVLARTADPVGIVEPAHAPSSAVSPKPLRNALLAGFLGLVLGVGIALLRHSVDRRITAGREVQRALDLPLMGYVRNESLGKASFSPNGGGSGSDEIEPFRILRANAESLPGAADGTVAVTSPLPEEGKSTVAAGYAYANALAGRRAVLVECDFRRPVMAQRLGVEPSPGLSDYLMGNAPAPDVLRSIAVSGPTARPLPVIPAGVDVDQPAELIASAAFGQFLAQIGNAYDTVVLDCAPLLPVGDSLRILPAVDAVLLCIRVGQTTRDQAVAAKEALDRLPQRPTGLVITGLARGGEEDYSSYSYAAHGGHGSSAPA